MSSPTPGPGLVAAARIERVYDEVMSVQPSQALTRQQTAAAIRKILQHILQMQTNIPAITKLRQLANELDPPAHERPFVLVGSL